MIYQLSRPTNESDDSAYACVTGGGEEMQRIPKCQCGKYMVPTGKVLPLQITLYGSLVKDIVWCDGHEFVVNRRLARILEENRITGYIEYCVNVAEWLEGGRSIFFRRLLTRGVLRYLHVVGNGGKARTHTPGIEVESNCNVCGSTEYSPTSSSIVLSRSEYDGSDVFFCEEYGYLFVSERVKILFEENNIGNYDITEVELRQ